MAQPKETGSTGRERTRRPDSLPDRIADYLPPAEVLAITPTAVDLRRRDEYLKTRPGDKFALTVYEGKLVMVPSWHPLNQTTKAANATVYGTGSMETLTMVPVLDSNESAMERDIVSANIESLGPRMDRLYDRALRAREIKIDETGFPIDRGAFAQGITDLMAVLGTDVLVGSDGTIGIASIRVQVGPGMGKFGKSAIGAQIDATVESYYTQPSFPEVAYNGEGLVVSAGPDQRFTVFRGKHSSHYGEGGRIGEISKGVGAADAILFAPYRAHDGRDINLSRIKDPRKLERAMMEAALSDGLGAELMAVTKDGKILLPPMDVNRLRGVTAEYIKDHLAPALGYTVEERDFSLQDVDKGKIIGLFFAGNAARIAAIREVVLHDADGNNLRKVSIKKVPEEVKVMIDRFEKETRGIVPASGESLVTPVDLETGKTARRVLEQAFAAWM